MPTFALDGDGAGNKELKEAWKQVEAMVQQLAQSPGQADSRLKQDLEIEDVLQLLDHTRESGEKDAAKYARVKEAVELTLRSIKHVGDIVASGVSTVLGPATLCANALTFVITAWQGYVGIFDNLAELLERCTDFFVRLKYYKDHMDTALSFVAVAHLQLFVAICDRSVRLRKKHVRLMAFARKLFVDDDQISGYLAKMAGLVDREHGLVEAQIFKNVKDTAVDLKSLVEEKKEQKRDTEVKNLRRNIVKALGFEEAELDKEMVPVPTWRAAYDKINNLRIEDSGGWVLGVSDGALAKWMLLGGSRDVPQVFLLEGEEGSGKTFMMPLVIRILMNADLGPLDWINWSVAHLLVRPEQRRTQSREDISGAIHRSLLWQCVLGSELMMRSVGQLCEKIGDTDGWHDKWKRLFLQNPDREKTSTRFFVLLDGLDDDFELLLRLLRLLCDDQASRKVRVFLTARPDTAHRLRAARIAFESINMRDNGDDITAYIDHRMDQMDTLKDTADAGTREWRTKIAATLRERCRGDYCGLSASLDAISNVDIADDIEEVLQIAGKTRADRIAAELRQLDDKRTPKEIAEINEMILWIQRSKRPLTAFEMEAVLAAKGYSGSLLRFDQKLKIKYTIFAVDPSGFVQFRLPEIGREIPTKQFSVSSSPTKFEAARKEKAIDRRRSVVACSSKEMITEGEIRIVKHFLATVCPADLYQRFGFDKFFADKLEPETPPPGRSTIHYDPENADIRIVLSSLKILTEPAAEQTRAIRRYAAEHLLEHLRSTDLDTAEPSLKSAAGPLLVKLFTSDPGIDALFWSASQALSDGPFLRDMRIRWLHSFDGVETLQLWLRDGDVARDILAMDDSAFVAAFLAPEANLHEALLAPAARRLAEKLLSRDECWDIDSDAALGFLNGYTAKLSRRETAAMRRKGHLEATGAGTEALGAGVEAGPVDDATRLGGNQSRGDFMEMPRAARDIQNLDEATIDQVDKRTVNAAEVRRIEEWAISTLNRHSVVRTSLWELNWALLLTRYQADAESGDVGRQRLRKALETDPTSWIICHHAAEAATDEQETIDLLNRSIQGLDDLWSDESSHESAEDDPWQLLVMAKNHVQLGHAYWRAKELDKAAKHHRESFEYAGTCFSHYMTALRGYENLSRSEDIVALLELIVESADEWNSPFTIDQLYSSVFAGQELYDLVWEAVEALNRWDLVIKLFTIAAQAAGRCGEWGKQFTLLKKLGDTLQMDDTTQHEASIVESWEAAVQVMQTHPTGGIQTSDAVELAGRLVRVYLEQAMRHLRWTRGTPDEAAKSAVAQLLQKMAALRVESASALDNSAVSCAIARCQLYMDNRGEAKKAVGSVMQSVLELLSDSDPSNDTVALWGLVRVASTFSDHANTILAFQVMNIIQAEELMAHEAWVRRSASTEATTNEQKTPDEVGETRAVLENRQEMMDNNVSEPPEPDVLMGCDGCDKDYHYASDMYLCCDCIHDDIETLDEECYALLLEGEVLPMEGEPDSGHLDLCSKDHEFVHLPKWDVKRTNEIPSGSLSAGDSVITLEEWKAQLRAEYLPAGAADSSTEYAKPIIVSGLSELSDLL